MDRHYDAVHSKNMLFCKKRNIEWLYKKCYDYASQSGKLEVNNAKAYLKSDLKLFGIFSLMVTVSLGLGTESIKSLVYELVLLINGENGVKVINEMQTERQSVFGVIFMFVIIKYIAKASKVLKKEHYLLCILEDVGEVKKRCSR